MPALAGFSVEEEASYTPSAPKRRRLKYDECFEVMKTNTQLYECSALKLQNDSYVNIGFIHIPISLICSCIRGF